MNAPVLAPTAARQTAGDGDVRRLAKLDTMAERMPRGREPGGAVADARRDSPDLGAGLEAPKRIDITWKSAILSSQDLDIP